jgi:hypothetical protein
MLLITPGTRPDVLNRAAGTVYRPGLPARLYGVAPGLKRRRRAASAGPG